MNRKVRSLALALGVVATMSLPMKAFAKPVNPNTLPTHNTPIVVLDTEDPRGW